jgi:hypothetical protein
VIPKESTAQLKGQSPDTFSYSADVTAIRLRASFSSFGDHARAEGRYVVVTLKVTNTSNGPAKWGASDQTRLLVGASPVREASRAEEDDPYSMTSQFSLYAIQPGQTRVGDVIFDVSPSKLASSVGRSAMPSALVLVAIGDQVEGAKSGVIVVLGR